MKKDEQQKNAQKVNVTFKLEGEDAERFLRYMEREKIKLNSVAGLKLALERLDQVAA